MGLHCARMCRRGLSPGRPTASFAATAYSAAQWSNLALVKLINKWSGDDG